MTLWYRLLPCLLPVIVPANEGLKLKPDASHMVADALAAEATWRAFPGFVADLEIECNGEVSQGRLIVERDGRVSVEQVPNSHGAWAVQHLGCIVRQRLFEDEIAEKTWSFPESKREMQPIRSRRVPHGRTVGPCYWIQNGRFHSVEVHYAKAKQRLTVLKTERNADNKHLPVVLVSHRWNTHIQELNASETTLVSWLRVSGSDLPSTIEVISAGIACDATTPVVGRIALTRHQLFSPAKGLLAGR
jgi:hypothetical protein